MPRYNNNNNHRNRQQKPRDQQQPGPNQAELEQNPVLQAFHQYSRELDEKHDRHERIVKLSRDITIEAKRIIFLLHTIDGRKQNKDRILQEAEQRLHKVIEVNFKAVAKELHGQDPYQHRWAYSPGLQEFIEAYTFYEYFRNAEGTDDSSAGSLVSDWNALQQKMLYEETTVAEPSPPPKEETVVDAEGDAAVPIVKPSTPTAEPAEVQKFQFLVDPTEYILGVSDLTGELMRRCINSLGSGETTVCVDTCKVLQAFYTGYISLHVQRCRELSRKIFTMRQSLLKAENVCYNVKVRGGEAAKWGAGLDGNNKQANDEADEGFY